MRVLFLGGTAFVGRHAAEAAIAAGHDVTLFHRGSKGAGLIPGAKDILGDRQGDLSALQGLRWDAVIDCCGYVPGVVQKSCEALVAHADRYLFVSTISVYKPVEGSLKLHDVEPRLTTEDVDGETYGKLKIECEAVVTEAFAERALLVRPGLLIGPHDPTGRFSYWVQRFMDGGDVVAPAVQNEPLQLLDARDLGRFMIRALESRLSGPVDAVGEPGTFASMIEACRVLNPSAQVTWVTEEELARQNFEWPFPVAYPASSGAEPLFRIEDDLAKTHGLERRPLVDSARDVASWLHQNPSSQRWDVGPSRDQERQTLEQLKDPPPKRSATRMEVR